MTTRVQVPSQGALFLPRKRPRQQRSIAMVDAILDASARILVELGQEALTTNTIAERAGVSIGSLYQYFSCRDAIVVALLNRFESRMRTRMQAALAQSGGELRESLAAMIRTALSCHFETPHLAAALETEEIRMGSTATVALSESDTPMSHFIQHFVHAHSAADSAETEQVARRVEGVGRALVDDALRRRDNDPYVADYIVCAVIECAPPRFWTQAARPSRS